MSSERLTNRKVAAGGAGLILLVLLAVAPAFACGGNRGTLTASPTRADAGTPMDIGGSSFQPGPELLVKVRWGGPSGQLLAEVSPDAAGAFNTRITVPAGAETGFHQISATQRQPDNSFFSATLAVEVQGVPTPASPAPVASQPTEPASTPAQATPAPASPAPQAAPAQARTGAQTSAARTPTVARATPVAAAAPVAAPPAPASPAPVAVAEPAAVPSAGPAPAPPVVESIPALPTRDPAVMGGPRTVAIDSGAPLWMLVPLVGASLLLFAASCAAIVSDVRQRRTKAKVSA